MSLNFVHSCGTHERSGVKVLFRLNKCNQYFSEHELEVKQSKTHILLKWSNLLQHYVTKYQDCSSILYKEGLRCHLCRN